MLLLWNTMLLLWNTMLLLWNCFKMICFAISLECSIQCTHDGRNHFIPKVHPFSNEMWFYREFIKPTFELYIGLRFAVIFRPSRQGWGALWPKVRIPTTQNTLLLQVSAVLLFLSSSVIIFALLAHLSRRLTRWAYSIPMVCRPSVVHTFKWISLKPVGQSWSNFYVASLGWGKGCIRFWGRLDHNSWFHGTESPHWLIMGKISPPFLGCFWSDSFYICR